MADLTAAIRAMARNGIRLRFGGQPDTGVGASRFGGVPDVPAEFVWPVFETAAYDDDDVRPRPLTFLAQFNCARLAPLDTDGLLPKEGVLSFFYELGSQRWGFDPADRGCARVFWFPDSGALAAELIAAGTTRLILGHLSQENNTPALAERTVTEALHSFRRNGDYLLEVAPVETTGKMVVF